MQWINSHGFLVAGIGFGMACVISLMPPLPPGSGFWQTWAYRCLQFVGASLDKAVLHSQYAASFQSLKIDDKTVSPEGDVTTSHLEATTAPKTLT